MVSSPFIRCLQTAQPICDALGLPGVITCNGIVDVFSHHFGIHEQPVVPADDIADHGIRVVSSHNEPLPTFPEHFKDGMNRCTHTHMQTHSFQIVGKWHEMHGGMPFPTV